MIGVETFVTYWKGLKKMMNESIICDIHRYAGKTSLGAILKRFVLSRLFKDQLLVRMNNEKGLKGKVGKILFYVNRHLSSNIQKKIRYYIGNVFYIGHNEPIIVNRYT